MKYSRLFASLFVMIVVSGVTLLGAEEQVVLDRVSSEEGDFRVVRVAGPLSHPWGMVFLPNREMLITERGGSLIRVSGTEREAVQGLPEIAAVGQGGLLDITLHPEFEHNSLIYFSFAAPGSGGSGTAVARGRLNGSQLEDTEIIFSMNNKSGGRVHFGSRLIFLDDGTLLLTIGDRGVPDRAQELSDHAGSTIRINDDGSVPSDNPFRGRSGVAPEIYTYGNRNAQGMAIHPESRDVWQSEHGPRGGDELNIIRPGLNYGWPVVSHGRDYRTGEQIGEGTTHPDMEDPVVHWSPAVAPGGISFYTGREFPNWQGDLFVASLVDRHLRRIVLDGNEVVHQEVLLRNTLGRIRDVLQGPDDMLYLITDAPNGGLYRIEPIR